MDIPLIAFGENKKRLQQLALLYSILPRHLEQPESGSQFISRINDMLLQNNWANDGDPVIIVASDPITRRGITNRVVIHYIGEQFDV
jgi:pyruvate kinase